MCNFVVAHQTRCGRSNLQPLSCSTVMGMEQPTVVTRTVDLEVSPQDLWALVGDCDQWSDWMVDESAVEVAPGSRGRVRDDGVDRGVRITEVVEGERVQFDWWPTDRPDSVSTVELVVVPRDSGAVLHIAETFPSPRHLAIVMVSASTASVAWDVRAACIWASSMTHAVR